jgi:hypothetical protein
VGHPPDLAEGVSTQDPVNSQARVALELGQRTRRELTEDTVDPASVEAQG